MKVASILASIAVVSLAAGCKKKESAAPGGLVASLKALDAEACACKDQACAAGIQDKLITLSKANQEPEEADLSVLQETQAHLDDCLAKLNPRVVSYVAMADEVCACTDAACATKVATKLKVWIADLKGKKNVLSHSDFNVMTKVGTEAGKCLTAFGVPIPQ
ncbi:MAG: hypothetical protein K8W52_01230 [Deltaproteobacteria bacterium]|nr:hypothetical protein [Deltaproteobacteria bacterium]